MRPVESLRRAGDRLNLLLGDRRRQRRVFVAYCLLVIVAYVGGVRWSVITGDTPWSRGDYVIFHTAARIVREGSGQRLYDLGHQARVQQEILRPYGHVFEGGVLPYNYPPFVALPFVPLSLLSLRSAFLVWNLVNVGLILSSVALLMDVQERLSSRAFVFASVVIFAFFPVMEGLWKGQSSFVVLFALALGYWGLTRDRCYLAGAALALGLVKPQLVALVIVLLLYKRAWRTVVSFSVTAGILAAVSWAVVGFQGILEYASLLRQMSGWAEVASIHPELMANLRGTAHRAALLAERWVGVRLSDGALTLTTAVLYLGVLVLVLHSWRVSRGANPAGFDLQFALTLIAGLLISPHLYGHDLSLLVLTGWLVVQYAASTGRKSQGRWVIAAGHLAPLWLLVATPMEVAQQIVALGLMLLLVVLTIWAHQDGTSRHISLS